jgi:hypothetical protein
VRVRPRRDDGDAITWQVKDLAHPTALTLDTEIFYPLSTFKVTPRSPALHFPGHLLLSENHARFLHNHTLPRRLRNVVVVLEWTPVPGDPAAAGLPPAIAARECASAAAPCALAIRLGGWGAGLGYGSYACACGLHGASSGQGQRALWGVGQGQCEPPPCRTVSLISRGRQYPRLGYSVLCTLCGCMPPWAVCVHVCVRAQLAP